MEKTLLAPGDRVPPFTLPDQGGRLWDQEDLMGRRAVFLVVPGQVDEEAVHAARGLHDHLADFHALETLVFAVTPGPVQENARVAAGAGLGFPVLADVRGTWSRGLGVVHDRRMHATTFLVGPSGRVQRVYSRPDPRFHGAEVIRDILDVVRPQHARIGVGPASPTRSL